MGWAHHVGYRLWVRLRCPECLQVVVVDDATPTERLPTHCARCALTPTEGRATPQLEVVRRLQCARCENAWDWPARELEQPDARVQCGRCQLTFEARSASAPEPVVGAPDPSRLTLVLPSGPPPRKAMVFGSNAVRAPLWLARSADVALERSVDASCPDCGEVYRLRSDDLPQNGRVVQCSQCRGVYRVLQAGALSDGATVTRQTRCVRCHTTWNVSGDVLANADEVVCAQCRHRFRPAVGDGLASVPAPEERNVRSESPQVRHGSDRLVTCPNCAITYVAEVPRDAPLQCTRCQHIFSVSTVEGGHTVRCASCRQSWTLSAAQVERDDEVACPRCLVRARPSGLETFRFAAPPAAVPEPPPTQPATEPGRSHVIMFGAGPIAPPPAPRLPVGTIVQCTACQASNDLANFRVNDPVATCRQCGAVLSPTRQVRTTMLFAETARPAARPVGVAPPPPAVIPRPPQPSSPLPPRRAFIGVTAARAGLALQERGRRIPLDVWLALADQLIATVERAELNWALWTGPYGFGVDLDGAVQVFAIEPQLIGLHRDWVSGLNTNFEDQARLARVWSVCRTLVWLLDPFPTLLEHHERSAHGFDHPQLTPGLRTVLDQGLTLAGLDTLETLRGRLLEAAAPVKPASKERLKAVLFAVGFDVPLGDDLPPQWRGGALQVRLDSLLEQAEPVERCPADPRGPRDEAEPVLMPTRTLELLMTSGGQPIRRVSVTRELGFPERVALPSRNLKPGEMVGLELRHPRQNARVTLEGIVEAGEFARPIIDERTRARLDVLLRSLSDEPRIVMAELAPALEAEEPPEPESEPEPVSEPLAPPTPGSWGTIVVTLPFAILALVLVSTEVISLATASKLGVAVAVVVVLMRRAGSPNNRAG